MKLTDQFQQWLNSAPSPWIIGEVMITSGYFLAHKSDLNSTKTRTIQNENEWTDFLLRDEKGQFRPLKASPNLPRGWSYGPLHFKQLLVALQHLYPVAIAHALQAREGNLAVTSYSETAQRQTGRFAIIKNLTEQGCAELVAQVCEKECLKVRLWRYGVPSDKQKYVTQNLGEIPLLCPEACNYFVSKAREKLKPGAVD